MLCHSIVIKPIKPINKLHQLLQYINNPDEIIEILKKNIYNVIIYTNNFIKNEAPFINYYKTVEELMELNEYTINLTDFTHCHAYLIEYNNDNILESNLIIIKNEKEKPKKIIDINKININFSFLNSIIK